MRYYMAPLEGVTGYIYRNAYAKYFYPLDKYFTPFLSPHTKKDMNSRERNDILPTNNSSLYVVPQILTNQVDGFLTTAKSLEQLGYCEVNLNLGCPSGTVVSKMKGAGFLAQPDAVHTFLEKVINGLQIKISVKTRLGISDPNEFERIMQIFNQYPLEEVIIHPRVQQDFYKNVPNWEVFAQALSSSTNPICYNGDICTKEQFDKLQTTFPKLDAVMIGRGILANPGLVGEIHQQSRIDKAKWKQFHSFLLNEYKNTAMGDRNVLFRMKELWFYIGKSFKAEEKMIKKILKTEKMEVYEELANAVFDCCKD